MSLGRKVLRSVSWTTFAVYVNAVVSLVGNIALARILVPEDFGTYALSVSALAILFMFSGFGSQESIVQCRDGDLTGLIPTAFWMTLLPGGVLAICGSLLGWILAPVYGDTAAILIFLLSWLSFLSMIANTYSAVMERDIRYKPIALTQSAATVVSFGSAVLAAMSGWGIWALFVRQATSCAISLIGFAWSSKYRLTFVFDRRAAKWIWVFGWKIMINRIGEVLYESVDKLVVGSVFGTGKLGHYNNAYRLSLVGHQFGFGVLSSIAFSTFATIQNENSKLEFAFSKLCFWLARFAFFVGLLVWCCGESTVVLVYGEKWRLAGELFERMWIFVLALPLESGIRIFLIGSGHIEAALRMRSLQLGIFVPGVVGVAYFGDILTLPYIVNVSILFSLLLGMYYSAKIVQINWRYVMERPLMAMAATILLTWAGGGIAIPNEGNAFFQVASTGFLVSALFVALMILLNGKSIWAEWSLVREKVKFGEEGKAT